jgi:hypothetical protein
MVNARIVLMHTAQSDNGVPDGTLLPCQWKDDRSPEVWSESSCQFQNSPILEVPQGSLLGPVEVGVLRDGGMRRLWGVDDESDRLAGVGPWISVADLAGFNATVACWACFVAFDPSASGGGGWLDLNTANRPVWGPRLRLTCT